MALDVGSRLGPYEIAAKIGEGGMGEVYRARDTKLDRDVALKVLPQAFTEDPDRLARFEREAKVLASLNHPGIAGIYGLEESGDTRALVLELVEGPTLADRIAKGPIPLDEVLPIAKQIAEALEAAHEAGVIHRDLKPANIKVKDDGTVKVLDFGLAKALDSTPEGDPSQSPTLTAAATQMGVIMGTAAYMSPEQARGKPTDRRADVWAFGAVVFEMLTGKRAFEGEDVSVTLADVIRAEPAWESLPATTPPNLRNVLERCLKKEPRQRVQAVGDVRLAMEGAFETVAPMVSNPPRPHGAHLLGGVVGLVVGSVIAGLVVWALARPPALSPTRFTIDVPDSVQTYGRIRLSPDGGTLAFNGWGNGSSRVYLRRLDQLAAEPVRGTEETGPLTFSPDGTVLVVTDVEAGEPGGVARPDATIKRVPLAGGPATTISSGRQGGVAWGPDDTLVMGSGAGGLELLRATGGEPTPLTTLADGELGHLLPTVLPNGRGVLFSSWTGAPDTSQVAVVELETGARTNLAEGTTPAYAQTGHLIFFRDGSLWAVAFDQDQLQLRGEPTAVVEDVASYGGVDAGAYTLADNGTLAYLHAQGGATRTLGWVNRQGEVVETLFAYGAGSLAMPRLSPEGTRVAFRRRAMSRVAPDIWLWDLAGQRETRLTDTGNNQLPAWTPDGSAVSFSSGRGHGVQLYIRPSDLSRDAELIQSTKGRSYAGSWTPDGGTLVYYAVDDQNTRDIWTLPTDGSPGRFFAAVSNRYSPRLSLNGQWVAYVSDETGENRVYVQAFPDGGSVYPVSGGPGGEPIWSHDGTEIFYRNRDELWTVQVRAEREFTAGRAELLFRGPYLPNGFGNPNYDVSPDGKKFLMVLENPAETAPMTVVENWHEELKRLVPLD